MVTRFCLNNPTGRSLMPHKWMHVTTLANGTKLDICVWCTKWRAIERSNNESDSADT